MLGLPPLPSKYKGVAAVAVVLLAVVVSAAIYGQRGWMHLRELGKKQQELEALALDLQRHNRERQEHLRRLDHDDAYLEKLVRERLGWVKPGETIYRVRGVTTAPNLTAAPPQESPPDSPPVLLKHAGGPEPARSRAAVPRRSSAR